ncbi:TrmB family transcriptional regulator [Halegenticoccus tardaugens]|uniref:TrmB family transcriptional regulator n=1 Tax=Halegenticoccus tardaugens TaxID=2071624 RepID=UPI00100B6ADF|nr:helix-turn-helix domain-containing protein [Halegenticoccus tardaugens]
MTNTSPERESIDLLQQLGMKQYEAECFVALTRLSKGGTAKEISDVTDVPRTRVYDAIRTLEAQGLVEVQHSSPQRFRALSIDEATHTLRRRYDSKVDSLRETLARLEPEEVAGDERPVHEVWSLSGETSIESRTRQLVDDADEEILFLASDDAAISGPLLDAFADATERGVSVAVGTLSDASRRRVRDFVPEVRTLGSGLKWLRNDADDAALVRVLLVDWDALLVSSRATGADGPAGTETAIYGSGLDNGVVVLVRRLLSTEASGVVDLARETT